MILLLMCAAIGLTHAQAQLSFGVKAGANFSTISKIDLSSIGPGGQALSGLFESKYLPGYHVGLYTRYNLSPAMGVQAELLYSMMGYKITTPLVADASVKTQLHYLTVPVLFRYTLPNIGLYAELGPQAGFFLKDNITVTGSLGGRSSDITKSGSQPAASVPWPRARPPMPAWSSCPWPARPSPGISARMSPPLRTPPGWTRPERAS